MKVFAVVAILVAFLAFTHASPDPVAGNRKPIQYKRCETATVHATKYLTQPVVKSTYIHTVVTKKVPSTYETYITSTSTYVDYQTVCNKIPH